MSDVEARQLRRREAGGLGRGDSKTRGDEMQTMQACDCGDSEAKHQQCECGGVIHADPKGRYDQHCGECIEASERDREWLRRHYRAPREMLRTSREELALEVLP